MNYNRQNFRPVNNPYPQKRPASCAMTAGNGQDSSMGTCVTQACGSPCPTAQLEEMQLAMAYVPWQTFGTMYPMAQGLRRGTMFPSLDFEFTGRRCN